MNFNDTFTSTGHKFFAHQEVMENLRNGKGQPITCHIMSTDICNHSCAFCSVQARAGDVLPFDIIMGFIDILMKFGLKSCILSGGGNPILYKCKKTGKNFNDVVDAIHGRGLEIGLITNGMPLREHFHKQAPDPWYVANKMKPWDSYGVMRKSWSTVTPETLDKLTWVRISMVGLDHAEREVYVPDIDHSKTTLGFSYVAHDIYNCPEDPHHGKVSTLRDLQEVGVATYNLSSRKVERFEDRIEWLVEKFKYYVNKYRPRYLRLLPNCLEPPKIEPRCKQLQYMTDEVNEAAGQEIVFVQYKPPMAPKACYLGYMHPVLNCDGYVYPCDSCVLNEAAGHSFANPWRICHWSEIGKLYDAPVRSLIADPAKLCPGCVFHQSNKILGQVVDGETAVTLSEASQTPEHVNFV